MESYEKYEKIEDKENLLADINVIYNFDASKAKKLGKAASKKIYKILCSNNSEDII